MARGRVIFEEDRCKGCGLCISFCARGVLEFDLTRLNAQGFHPVSAARPEACTGCTNCSVMCPDLVITVMREG